MSRVADRGGINARCRSIRRRVVAVAAAVSLLLGVSLAVPSTPARAAVGSAFDAGYIVSDAVFYDGFAMNSVQIQSFIQSQVGTCNSSYACLSTYRQSTPTIPADSYCSTYTGGSNETAALIISKVGRSCGISQKALLVLLEKEQSLVSSSTPSKVRFDKATGMACPDTAPCDPKYSGFFYQVYYAARQYQLYAARPGNYNYRAGQTNKIAYSPNNCGTRDVFVQNVATAGLYNYTPYTPNSAALANLYGTGDVCSSYGNRNFWRIFSDWFGSPTAGSSLVRTTANASVYLVAGGAKYSLSSSLLRAFSKMGDIGYVSQQYLNGFTLAGPASLVVRTPSGTIGLLDNGAIRPMTSCTVVSYYGGSCGGSYVQLTDYQTTLLRAGGSIQTYLKDSTGARYVMREGVRREVLDDQSLSDFGVSATFATVAPTTTAALALGDPIVRDSVFIDERGNDAPMFYADGELHDIAADAVPHLNAARLATGSLTSGSLAKLTTSNTRFDGVVSNAGATKVVSVAGTVTWDPAITPPVQAAIPVSDEFVAQYPTTGTTVTAGSVLTGITRSGNYLVTETQMRTVSSSAWAALGETVQQVATKVPNIVIRYHPKGSSVLVAGTQVKVSGAASIFLVDGFGSRVQTPSFDVTKALGVTGHITVSPAAVVDYPRTDSMLSYMVSCNGTTYIGVAGQLRAVTPELMADYGLPITPLATATCGRLTVGSDMGAFIRVNNRSIYFVSDGMKHQVMSMARYNELRGSQGYVNVSTRFADQLPTGPAA